jgi:hypothetical protein
MYAKKEKEIERETIIKFAKERNKKNCGQTANNVG